MATRQHGIHTLSVADEEIKGIGGKFNLRWVSVSADAGDSLVLQDDEGNNIWESVAGGANHIDVFPIKLKKSMNLLLKVIDSGVLYIYEM
ncbi:MAG: hypothetical protein WC516_06640 [Patescibacteria group bacterium]|jgi:hypothetical protein